jgi:MFS family permease
MRLPRNVIVFGLGSFLTDVHSEIVLPLLPLFLTRVLGLPATVLGVIEGVADMTASLLKIVSGRLSDRLGRRKGLIVAGYALSTLAKPFLSASHAGSTVLVIRFADRVGKGIRSAPRDAALADAVPASERGAAFGFHRAMDTAGAVVGTTIAFLLMQGTGGNYRAIFLWAAIPGVLAVILLAALVRETPRARTEPVAGRHPSLGVPGPLGIFLGVHGLFCIADFSYAFYLLRAEQLGVAAPLLPMVYLLYNLVYAMLPMPLGRLSDRLGRIPVLVAGYGFTAVSCLAFALAPEGWIVWPLFALYGMRTAFTETIPRALTADLCEPWRRGTGIGAFHFVAGIAAFPASFIAGWLWDTHGARAAFLLGAGVALAATLLLLLLAPRIKSGLQAGAGLPPAEAAGISSEDGKSVR